ncbi:MAG TPA: HIT domain-containing protein [bacterium]|nr:HIT domain-containing protein [bacterium]
MIIKKNLFSPHKYNYVRGVRPKVDCILCAVINKEKNVDKLVVFENKLWLITLNLFPYNPGHIMIFPRRHIEDVRLLNEQEWHNLQKLQNESMNILEKIYNPTGYNLGFNIGKDGGASIAHIHYHIVPRYKNEIGFVEIFSDARIIVEDPQITKKKLQKEFKKIKI